MSAALMLSGAAGAAPVAGGAFAMHQLKHNMLMKGISTVRE